MEPGRAEKMRMLGRGREGSLALVAVSGSGGVATALAVSGGGVAIGAGACGSVASEAMPATFHDPADCLAAAIEYVTAQAMASSVTVTGAAIDPVLRPTRIAGWTTSRSGSDSI